MKLGWVTDFRTVARSVVIVVRPCNHDDTRCLNTPIVEHFVVGSTVMGIDGIIERIARTGHTIHRLQCIRTSHTSCHKRLVGSSHVMIEAFGYIIEIVRITHGCTMQTVHRLALTQPKSHHIEVNVTKCLAQDVLVLDGPWNSALEFRNPDETDATLRTRKLTAFDEFIQCTSHFNQGSRTGNIVISTQLHIAFIKVSTKDDFFGIGFRTLDEASRHFDFSFFHGGFDIGLDRNLFAFQESVSQGITITRSQVDAESRIVSTDTAIRNLDRVHQRTW